MIRWMRTLPGGPLSWGIMTLVCAIGTVVLGVMPTGDGPPGWPRIAAYITFYALMLESGFITGTKLHQKFRGEA